MPLVLSELLTKLDLAAARQGFQQEEIAPKIPAYSRKTDQTAPLVQLSAGIHGDEPASPLTALAFLENHPPTDFNWLLTPLLNPTGIALGTRENDEGHDLNRDYYQPQSTEIQAHLKWLARQPTPDLFIAFHEDYEASGFYFYEIQSSDRPSVRDAVLNRVSTFLAIEPGPIIDGHECAGEGWFFRDTAPSPQEFDELGGGYPEALLLAKKGCPLSLTFETPTHTAPLTTRIQAHLAALSAVLDELREF